MPGTAGTNTENLVKRAEKIAEKLRERASLCEELRRIPNESMEQLKGAGLFRALQPARYGGFEVSIEEFLRIAEKIAAGCGSTGWIYAVVGMHQWQIGMFPAAAQEAVWGENSDALASSSYVPSGIGKPTKGGYRLSGKWTFASGCDSTQWMILGGRIQTSTKSESQQVFFLVPKENYVIEDNWHVLGLSGTGSKTIVINDAFVPSHCVLSVKDASSGTPPGAVENDAPLFHIPFSSAISTCLCVPVLGMAQGTYDTYVSGLKTWTTRGAITGAGKKVAELSTIQLRVAEAAASIDAARLLLMRGAAETMSAVRGGRQPETALRVRTRRDHAFAVKLCVRAIDMLFEAAGGQGLYTDNFVQRNWRDIHAAAKHISTNWDAVGSLYGKFVLGLEPEGGHF